MQINIQNNQENSYEKFKKFLNNPITKLSLSTAGGIAALSLIAKLIYDKIHQNKHQNKIYKELIINDVILSIADQIWFAKNFSGYSQDQIPVSTGFAQDKSDWTEANKLFSFNDNIYNKLSGVFSGDIKLSNFTVYSTPCFEFEFDNSNSIAVDFSEVRSTLGIRYTNRNFEENEITSYAFKFNLSRRYL